jgi:hypothetical protein
MDRSRSKLGRGAVHGLCGELLRPASGPDSLAALGPVHAVQHTCAAENPLPRLCIKQQQPQPQPYHQNTPSSVYPSASMPPPLHPHPHPHPPPPPLHPHPPPCTLTPPPPYRCCTLSQVQTSLKHPAQEQPWSSTPSFFSDCW